VTDAAAVADGVGAHRARDRPDRRPREQRRHPRRHGHRVLP
jgi:hypothetical protein